MTGLYVHIPFCASKCHYCDFVSFPGREGDFSRYRQAILREMALRAPLPSFDTAFFGGGTPSAVPPSFAGDVLSKIHLRPGAEVTSEANPNSLDADRIKHWRQAGVNRLSLGAQAFQDNLLAMLGRPHRWEQVRRAAQRWGDPAHLSLDLMYGLPNQTMGQWRKTLEQAVALEPGHLSCYSLIVEEGTPLHQWIAAGKLTLPDEELERDMHQTAGEYLASQGYRQYEVSNYARENRVCRHNMNYWARGAYVGLGCAAHSYMGNVRSANEETIESYCAAVEAGRLPLVSSERIAGPDAWFEEFMLGLRLTDGFVPSPAARQHFASKIAHWHSAGLIWDDGISTGLSPRGVDVMNGILTDFLED